MSVIRTDDIRNSSDLPLSDEEILEMIEISTPLVDPSIFEGKKSDERTLAVFGVLPVINDGVESYDRHLLLMEIINDVQQDPALEKYGYVYDGPVIGYGIMFVNGFISIYIDAERAGLLTQEDFNQMQKTFEKHANENGVTDLPLVIEYGEKGVFTPHAAELPPETVWTNATIIAICFGFMAALILIVLIPKIRL